MPGKQVSRAAGPFQSPAAGSWRRQNKAPGWAAKYWPPAVIAGRFQQCRKLRARFRKVARAWGRCRCGCCWPPCRRPHHGASAGSPCASGPATSRATAGARPAPPQRGDGIDGLLVPHRAGALFVVEDTQLVIHHVVPAGPVRLQTDHTTTRIARTARSARRHRKRSCAQARVRFARAQCCMGCTMPTSAPPERG